MNPVRAAMVAQPSEFRWSSHAANALGQDDPLLRPHPAYRSLACGDAECRLAYRNLFDEVLGAERSARSAPTSSSNARSATIASVRWWRQNSGAVPLFGQHIAQRSEIN